MSQERIRAEIRDGLGASEQEYARCEFSDESPAVYCGNEGNESDSLRSERDGWAVRRNDPGTTQKLKSKLRPRMRKWE
jgi:hypothetical protein